MSALLTVAEDNIKRDMSMRESEPLSMKWDCPVLGLIRGITNMSGALASMVSVDFEVRSKQRCECRIS